MTFDEFKTDALRTESRPENLNFSNVGLYELATAATQMSRILDTAKKTMFYGKPLDVQSFDRQLSLLSESIKDLQLGLSEIANPERSSVFHTPNLRIVHGSIGMFGEAGELLEALVRQMETGKLDLVNIAEETGDSDWYKAIIHDETGISEDTCRAKVIAKLKARYGDKFTSDAALNRDLAVERAILENTKAG